MGIRFGETVILGKHIHGGLEKGLSIERNAATECTAGILDKETGTYIARLWWWPPSGTSDPWQSMITLRSGESRALMLFARLENEPTRYFIFAPSADTASPLPCQIPTEDAKFKETHRFVVRITYSYGRQTLTFDTTISKEFDGRLRFQLHGQGAGSF